MNLLKDHTYLFVMANFGPMSLAIYYYFRGSGSFLPWFLTALIGNVIVGIVSWVMTKRSPEKMKRGAKRNFPLTAGLIIGFILGTQLAIFFESQAWIIYFPGVVAGGFLYRVLLKERKETQRKDTHQGDTQDK